MSDEAMVAEHRGRLFAIAYRMLGEVGEAEDAVQEALLRWTRAPHDTIDNPAGWLTTVLTRICLDRLTSAQRRRESYVGPWLPEPVATDDDPADAADMVDSLTLAFLVVLESLSPAERAALLLHDVFGYDHGEVAAMLSRSPAAVRQLTARARRHVADRRPRYESDAAQRRAVVEAFVDAVAGRDLDGLIAVLSPDVEFVADGGGVVAAVRHPQRGARRVAGIILGLARGLQPSWSVAVRELNGEPGLVVSRADGTVDSVWVLHSVDGRIEQIHAVRNPRKLQAVTRAVTTEAGRSAARHPRRPPPAGRRRHARTGRHRGHPTPRRPRDGR
jgi:RNA polymerase sigma-70 factor (ECF subfamily)